MSLKKILSHISEERIEQIVERNLEAGYRGANKKEGCSHSCVGGTDKKEDNSYAKAEEDSTNSFYGGNSTGNSLIFGARKEGESFMNIFRLKRLIG